MKVLLLEPGRPPEQREIDSSLKSMQSLVGGFIQAVYPFSDPVALICNEEGKLMGLPYNRALCYPETGEVYDIVSGPCFLCGAPPDSDHFTSLTPEQLGYYTKQFQCPEFFLKTNEGLMFLKIRK